MDGLLDFRRALRRDSTDVERLLWRLLRDRRFENLKFRRQHPVGPFILDFYCPARCLAVELDGGQHFEPETLCRDRNRTRYLQQRGIRVLRFTNLETLHERAGVLSALANALAA